MLSLGVARDFWKATGSVGARTERCDLTVEMRRRQYYLSPAETTRAAHASNLLYGRGMLF
jgi:hypothetical protein